MPNSVIEKHPLAEVLFDDFDFTDELPGDSELAAISKVEAISSDGSPAKVVVKQLSITPGSMTLSAVLKAGEDGEDYLVNFKAVGLTTAQKAVKQLELRVRARVIGAL